MRYLSAGNVTLQKYGALCVDRFSGHSWLEEDTLPDFAMEHGALCSFLSWFSIGICHE